MTADQTTATRWRHRRIVLSRGNAVERYPLPRDGEQAHHMPGAEVWWGESDDEAIAEVGRLDAEEIAREELRALGCEPGLTTWWQAVREFRLRHGLTEAQMDALLLEVHGI